ncbi:hypothetical protein [Arsenicicoccus dermatophilus]|uniref:hypothetical protein n=1 Tax=Arsenicicoccus dermatophilus TaxID=1076331 RepID=UPI0039174F48
MTRPPLPPEPVFSTQQAYALGWTRDTLAEAVRSGVCHRVLRGWFAAGPTPALRELHRETVVATHLDQQGAWVTSGPSACLWHDLPVDDRDLHRVLVTRRAGADGQPPPAHGSTTSRVIVRSHVEPQDVLDDVPVLRPAAAVAEYALHAGMSVGVAAADAALARGLVTEDDLGDALARRSGRRGIRAVTTLPRWTDPLAENPGESKARYRLSRAGFRLVSQVWCETPGGAYRLDWLVEGTATGIELDGTTKYLTDDGSLRSDRIRRQRRRDRDCAAIGLTLVHLTFDDFRLDDAGLRALVEREAGDALHRPTPQLRGRRRAC